MAAKGRGAADVVSKSAVPAQLGDFVYENRAKRNKFKFGASNEVAQINGERADVNATCSTAVVKKMNQSWDTCDVTSDALKDENVREAPKRLTRIYKVKDSDSDESSNELEDRSVPGSDSSANDFKSKIRNSFLKTCANTAATSVTSSVCDSDNLTKRIQNAYNNLSKSRPRAIIRSSSEDEDVVVSKNGCKETPISESSDDDIAFKESCLVKLRSVFPHYDSMEIQDALVKADWSVELAADSLNTDSNGKKSNGVNSSVNIKRTNNLKRSKECEYQPNKKIKPREMTDSEEDSSALYSKEEEIYDSDASEVDDTLTPARQMVLSFFESATFEELSCLTYCSKKKAESILQLRPFTDWLNLVTKFQNERNVSTDLIKSAKDVLNSRRIITQLMKKCEILAAELEQKISCLMNVDEKSVISRGRLTEQPASLNSNFKLAPYQLLGLNWLILMHQQNVNGILADEMGLGKTVQAISFLTYCYEQGNQGPFLIVVPSSIIDNWAREINTWSPSLNSLLYHGSQEYRRYLRMELFNSERNKYNIIISTYNLVAGAAEDRVVFKKLKFEYVVFDEAHLLKNMETQRYQHLMKIQAKRRLLLTGTPLQNNLVELMSLLGFLMPNMFEGKIEHLKTIFSMASKKGGAETQTVFEKERLDQAKRIMKPFILRRQKSDVLKELPDKVDEVAICSLSSKQKKLYNDLIIAFSKEVQNDSVSCQGKSGSGMMMQLRKLANHPLLMRYKYTDDKLRKMAKLMITEPTHENSEEKLVFEDMQVMSDFELHKLCLMYKSVSSYSLKRKCILNSGKFEMLDKLLPSMKTKGDRVLLFSQFVIVLDIVEEYMNLKDYKYLRLDGSTAVEERQTHIDTFTNDHSIFVFLLSTRAGGLGINLAAANVVILHDIDFNPYNDKQAVDRCHRVGQTKEVKIIRLVSKDTIEEAILRGAQNKLKLEKALIDSTPGVENDNSNVASLLKEALGLH